MLAMNYRRPYKVRAEQLPEPTIEHPNDAIVRVTRSVCIDAVGCEAAGSALQQLTGVKLKLQAGAATALHWAINSVRKGGVVSIVGVYGPTFNAVPIGNAINKGLTLRMNQASVKRHLPRLMEHIRLGHLKPSDLITHRVPLEEVDAAYHMFSEKLDGCIKPILLPPTSQRASSALPH